MWVTIRDHNPPCNKVNPTLHTSPKNTSCLEDGSETSQLHPQRAESISIPGPHRNHFTAAKREFVIESILKLQKKKPSKQKHLRAR